MREGVTVYKNEQEMRSHLRAKNGKSTIKYKPIKKVVDKKEPEKNKSNKTAKVKKDG